MVPQVVPVIRGRASVAVGPGLNSCSTVGAESQRAGTTGRTNATHEISESLTRSRDIRILPEEDGDAVDLAPAEVRRREGRHRRADDLVGRGTRGRIPAQENGAVAGRFRADRFDLGGGARRRIGDCAVASIPCSVAIEILAVARFRYCPALVKLPCDGLRCRARGLVAGVRS